MGSGSPLEPMVFLNTTSSGIPGLHRGLPDSTDPYGFCGLHAQDRGEGALFVDRVERGQNNAAPERCAKKTRTKILPQAGAVCLALGLQLVNQREGPRGL